MIVTVVFLDLMFIVKQTLWLTRLLVLIFNIELHVWNRALPMVAKKAYLFDYMRIECNCDHSI